MGKGKVMLLMHAWRTRHARLDEAALGSSIAVHSTDGRFMPADVERGQAREEVQRVVGKVIVDPPRHVGPTATPVNVIHQPGHHDASCRAALALRIRIVPDVSRVVGSIAGAIKLVLVAKLIDGGRAVTRANMDAPKGGLQRFQQLLAKLLASVNGRVRVIRNVAQAVPGRNLAVQEIAHEEVL